MRQIVLDTETTGLYAEKGDRIVEIGCVEVLNRQITGKEYHCYINPEKEMSDEVIKIHGITNEFLVDKPLFKDIAKEFCDFISGAELIIHNAPFDVGFINEEFKRLNLPPLHTITAGVIDTLELARDQFPNRSNTLDILCDRFKIDKSIRANHHGALIDSVLLAEVYLALTRGQKTFLMEEETPDTIEKLKSNAPFRKLIVQKASPEEDLAHDTYLDEMQKKLEESVIWRS